MDQPPARRVLTISRVGFVGGVERIVLTLAAGMAEYGWEPVLACPADGELRRAAEVQGLRVLPTPIDRMRITTDPAVLAGYPLALWRGAAAIERHCRELQIAVIHVHHPVTALYAARAARKLGIPLLLHVHEILPARPLYALAMRAALRHAAAVLCVSDAARQLALAMGAGPRQAQVLYNGVDAAFLADAPSDPVAEVRAAGPGPHIGTFGVLEPRKAQHILLDAFGRLLARFPNARVWVVGPAALKDKRGYAKRLAALAAAPPLGGRVVLAGYRPDMRAWLAAMDLVVQTSVADESFGMALAEAQAAGRPVVAARVGGMPEVVMDGVTGLIVPPDDPAALAAALERLLGEPALRRAFGERGALEARRRFAPDVFRAAVAHLYNALATGAGSAAAANSAAAGTIASADRAAGRATAKP